MIVYSVAIVWFVGHFICVYILNKRYVKVGLLMQFAGILLGPLAIPFAFFLGSKIDIKKTKGNESGV